MEAVTLTNISKRYGSVEALRGVSLSVAPGELFGIIGPDGAGKTSLFRILTTLLLADGGSASVCGLDVVKDYKAIRRRVGYMPGRFSLYPDLTVEENLNFFATVFHTTIEENYDLVRDIYRQIEPFRKRRAGALSGGMKQKLALSCALIHKPDVLFLDEPTTGVDPVSRKEFWGMLRRLKEQGITIIASTPIIDEARQCDRIAFINEGEIKGVDTPDRILTRFAGILCPPGLQHERVENHENNVIEVEGLTKRFGNFTAVDHISFQVHRGEIFGFLGANGAGKTTAMRMLTGLSRPTGGKACVAGFDVASQPEEVKKNIGYMSQKFSLYEDLKVWGGPCHAPPVLGADLPGCRRGHHRLCHHPLYGRGGVLRPHLHHGRRRHPCTRHSRGAETAVQCHYDGRCIPTTGSSSRANRRLKIREIRIIRA